MPLVIEHASCRENEIDDIKDENCMCDKENMRKQRGEEEKEPLFEHESRNKELKITSCVLCHYLHLTMDASSHHLL